jgi:hypothetical protein
MLCVVFSAFFVMPCIAELPSLEGKDNAPVSLSGGWVRASLPGADNSVAFLTLQNNTAIDKKIVAISCVVAQRCVLHQHTHVDGKMRMGKVNNLILPANSELKFASGGYHVMLIGVSAPLSVGAMVELTFIFEDNTKYSVNLPVKSVRDE